IGTSPPWNYVVLILLYSINGISTSFVTPTQHTLEKSEVEPSKLHMKLKDAYEQVIGFFRPVTCRYRDEQTLIPCHLGEDLNTTECLENNCCVSVTSIELKCYMPFKDNIQLTFRVLVLVAGGFLILGFLPFCCCVFLQRSGCVNPLRRPTNKVKEIVLKKREQSDDVYSPL
ncbi:FMR1N protein, partial [Galbula dea]|nr:FMR1N protein [Galbula dea]